MQTYYDATPWTQGIRSIGSMLAQRPYLQAMQRQREEQSRLTSAQTQDRLATADYTRARTAKELVETDQLQAEAGHDAQLAAALKKLTANPNDTDAQGDAIAGFGRAYKKNPEGTSKALGQLFAQFQARAGSTNYAQMGALQGDAASIANNQAKLEQEAQQPLHVSPGGALWHGGKVVYQNPSAAAAEQGFETITEDWPAQPEVPDVPEKKHWFGPNEPAIPGHPAQPARKVTRRIPISGGLPAPAIVTQPVSSGQSVQASPAQVAEIQAPNSVPAGTNQLAASTLPAAISAAPFSALPSPKSKLDPRIQAGTAEIRQIFDEANDAIARGANPDAVRAKIKSMGIDPGLFTQTAPSPAMSPAAINSMFTPAKMAGAVKTF